MGGRPGNEPVALKIAGGIAPLTVMVNGVPLAESGRRMLFFSPTGRASCGWTVMDARGAADSIMVRMMA